MAKNSEEQTTGNLQKFLDEQRPYNNDLEAFEAILNEFRRTLTERGKDYGQAKSVTELWGGKVGRLTEMFRTKVERMLSLQENPDGRLVVLEDSIRDLGCYAVIAMHVLRTQRKEWEEALKAERAQKLAMTGIGAGVKGDE